MKESMPVWILVLLDKAEEICYKDFHCGQCFPPKK